MTDYSRGSMRRLIKVFILLVVPLGLAYLVWPVHAALEIREAMAAGDTATLNRKVDWPALRTSLKSSITPETLARLSQEPDAPKPSMWQRIKAAVAPSMADSVIDRYVTPENLPVLLGYRRIYRGTVQPAIGPKEPPTVLAGTWLSGGGHRPFRKLLVQGPQRNLPVALPLRARGGGQVPPRAALRRHAGAEGLGVEADRPHRCRRRPLSRAVSATAGLPRCANPCFWSLPRCCSRSAMRRGPPGRRGNCARPSRRAIIPGIERRVDWPQLRANLKRTIAANLQDDTKSPDAGFLGKAVKRTLGPLVANRVIDAAVTPRTLARVLAGRLDAVEMARDAQPWGARARAMPRRATIRCRPGGCAGRSSRSPARFRIEVADRTEPGKRVVSIFALQGASWKLVDVYYRTLT